MKRPYLKYPRKKFIAYEMLSNKKKVNVYFITEKSIQYCIDIIAIISLHAERLIRPVALSLFSWEGA